MGRRRQQRKRATTEESPAIPLAAVDLLAGVAPDVELAVDDLPAGFAGATMTTPMSITVAEVGKQLRSGDPVVRRLIRTPGVGPTRKRRVPGAADLTPARPTPDKPGE
jgi:hypothetical protein